MPRARNRRGPGLDDRGDQWRGSWDSAPTWYSSPIWYNSPQSSIVIASDPIPVIQTMQAPQTTVVAAPPAAAPAPADTKKFLIGAGIAAAIFLMFQ